MLHMDTIQLRSVPNICTKMESGQDFEVQGHYDKVKIHGQGPIKVSSCHV